MKKTAHICREGGAGIASTSASGTSGRPVRYRRTCREAGGHSGPHTTFSVRERDEMPSLLLRDGDGDTGPRGGGKIARNDCTGRDADREAEAVRT
ncbi:Hypothetical protein NTJ_10137 [Nesidiocoris tenuis]|uniref:Uncharacterized protein n=1 Tax=Nesidiocoris tenuis TaxID=355587 RepID=A0ABN7AZC3_9HEMI|nr:Hypothetical protein NTJ_10137 [Nesidiocoris tenuis]